MANKDHVSVWTTVPVAVRDQIKAIAEQEERSISYIVRRILTRYLDTINAEQREELAKAMTSQPQLKTIGPGAASNALHATRESASHTTCRSASHATRESASHATCRSRLPCRMH